MLNSHRLAQNYNVRKSLFFLLAPLVGIGGYIINTQKNNVRSQDDIVLTNLNAVQVKNLAIESKSDVTGASAGKLFKNDSNTPKPSGNI